MSKWLRRHEKQSQETKTTKVVLETEKGLSFVKITQKTKKNSSENQK